MTIHLQLASFRLAARARGACLAFAALASLGAAAWAADADPDLYLEQVRGPEALATVTRWNARTAADLAQGPAFEALRERALTLLQDDQRIAEPDRIWNDRVFNLWQDAAHPRGLWRVSPLAPYTAGKPQWRTLIDVDALGRTEGTSWVFKGAVCRAPAHDRCMVALSDGGGDTVVQREFDTVSGRFVAGGFSLPAAKSVVAWAEPDTLYVATDFGPGSLDLSGYPRSIRRLARGAPLATAAPVLETPASEVGVDARVLEDGTRRWPVLVEFIDAFRDRVRHVAPDGRLVTAPLPEDAELRDVVDGRAIALLAKSWRNFAAGSVIAYDVADVLAGRPPRFELVFAPTRTQAVEQVRAGAHVVWIKLLDDVSGRLLSLGRVADGRWHTRDAGLPANATIDLHAVASASDDAYATVEGMLLPPTLFVARPSGPPARVQALPARFDASRMAVTQRFAISKDGTRVPYFLVRRRDATGPAPVLLHAYGGFRVSQTPTYLTDQPYRSGPAGLFWVEQGNAYVLANIRGGGEYGPAWHDATLREHRQRAFDDLYAVAEDLIKAGVTAPRRIAVSGRSNGGLLASVAITQRPDLFGAAVIGSPLTDMKRYSHLLAGASWIGEYGDPDKPADWVFISRYSPYQNLRAGAHYPVPLIYTSTEDDRVHPAHARKFAAKLERLGYPFFYHEATEGGHAAGADRREDAWRAALVTTYLDRELASPK